MRWVRAGLNKFVLVVAPLHGRGNIDGNGQGVRLLAYVPPAKPEIEPWNTTVLDDQLHVTHNFDVASTESHGEKVSEEIFYLGKEGALRITNQNDHWVKKLLPDVQGGGEIRMGRLSRNVSFLATVEPFHGDKLVVYEYLKGDLLQSPRRQVIDENLAQGHGLATGDFQGIGSDQIVVGWRNPNAEGKVGIKIFRWNSDADGKSELPTGHWHGSWLDENGIACEDLQSADLDADGDLDIVASGRSTHNLKIYWNQR
jgi:hypothetical protein